MTDCYVIPLWVFLLSIFFFFKFLHLKVESDEPGGILAPEVSWARCAVIGGLK